MMKRMLLAIDDSPAALAAATLAIELADTAKAELRIVHVVADGALAALLAASGVRTTGDWRERAGDSLLKHVAARAERAGLRPETAQVLGDPAEGVLAEAKSWPADLVVIGRSGRRGAGRPYVGHTTERVLEFAELPVIVVPPIGL